MLAVKGSDSIVFFDWDDGEFIRKIDVVPTAIFWNDAATAVILACSDSYFVLDYDHEKVNEALSNGNIDPEEGVDGSFELDATMNEVVRTGQWVGDCFLFTNASGRLNYYVGGETFTLAHLDHPMYLLGFVPREDRVFMIDKTYNVYSFKLALAVLNYQTAVVRKDFDAANEFLPSIPPSELAATARFLESQGYKQEALEVTTDNDHKFELAIDLRNLEVAKSILDESKEDVDSTDAQSKWKRLGDLALHYGNIELAQSCAEKAEDLSGLMLLYSSAGNKEGMKSLGIRAKNAGRNNVAFLALFITGQLEECIQLLVDTDRFPEAAFLARTYYPSKIGSVLELWKKDLSKINEKAAEALADPEKYGNLFPDLEIALQVEKMFVANRDQFVPATKYLEAKNELDLNLIELIKNQQSNIGGGDAMEDKQPEEIPASTSPPLPDSSSPAKEIQIAEGADPALEPHQPTPIKEGNPTTEEETESKGDSKPEEEPIEVSTIKKEASGSGDKADETQQQDNDDDSDLDLDMISDGDLEDDA